MSESLEVLVLPKLSADIVVRALGGAPVVGASVIAVLIPVPEAAVQALRFYDEDGRTVRQDLEAVAACLSNGQHPVGVASIDPVADVRGWSAYQNGACVGRFGVDDELWLPYDDEGFPDLDAAPVRTVDGVPPGWRRLRSCLDLGMKQIFSCRFTPVARRLEVLHSGRSTGVRIFLLRRGDRAVLPPGELPFQSVFGG